MPNVSINKNKGVIEWNSADWLEGQNMENNEYSILPGGLFNKISPVSAPMGRLIPGKKFDNLTTVSAVTAYLNSIVVDGEYAKATSSDYKLHKVDISTSTVVSDANWPHTITAHSGNTMSRADDCVIYAVNGVNYLMYSWTDSATWDVGKTTGFTFIDDFMSSVSAGPTNPLADNWGGVSSADYYTVSSSYPHPLIVGDDDLLYIGSGNILHAYDGSAGAVGTFYGAVLTLPAGYIITSFAKFNYATQNTLVIYAYRPEASTNYNKASCKAFFYNYLDSDPFKIVDIPDNYVNSGFTFNNTIGCMTYGQRITGAVSPSKDCKVMIYDGNSFKTIFMWNGTLPKNKNVTVSGEYIFFINQGYIYIIGKFGDGGYKCFPFAELTGSTNGAIEFVGRDKFYASTGPTTSGGLQKIGSSYAEYASYQSKYYQFDIPDSTKIQIQNIEVYFNEASDADAKKLTFSLLTENGTNTIVQYLQQTSTGEVKNYRTDSSGSPIANFKRFLAVKCEWEGTTGVDQTDTPSISKIKVYFDIINK